MDGAVSYDDFSAENPNKSYDEYMQLVLKLTHGTISKGNIIPQVDINKLKAQRDCFAKMVKNRTPIGNVKIPLDEQLAFTMTGNITEKLKIIEKLDIAIEAYEDIFLVLGDPNAKDNGKPFPTGRFNEAGDLRK